MEIIAALIAFFVGLWVFSDARSRGKSNGGAFLWLLGTWIILIVFLPLWLFVRPKKTYEVSVIDKPTMCVSCGKYYEGTPAFCSNCGGSLRG